LFVSSGDLRWVEAWTYIALTAGLVTATYLLLRSRVPDLLEERSRLRPGTKGWDRVLAPFVAVMGPVITMMVAGLEHRRGSDVSIGAGVNGAGFAVYVLGACIVLWAMLSNRFFAATVRIQDERGHRAVSDGPYQFVRHPGYVGMILSTIGTPAALGSVNAIVPAAATILVLILRTGLEDGTLQRELHGYAAYTERVRFRLLPFVW
jgi:protein-S-isoprenylcysteine O-methyltransferase Ste14